MSLSAASENFGFGALALQEVNNTLKNKQKSSWSYEHSGLTKHAHIHKSEYGFPTKHWR